MSSHLRVLAALLLLVCPAETADAEVFVRWDLDQVPSRDGLGITALLIPATNAAAIKDALAKGYTVHLELEDGALPGGLPLDRVAGAVVTGAASPERLAQLQRRLTSRSARVVPAERGGKWPHVRLNQVTRRNDVLQVSSRTEQPWLENNGALVRIAQMGRPESTPLLAYAWAPITVGTADQAPTRENYLVAIAEAASFGSNLVLPLHGSFQRSLLLGRPSARAGWQEIRRYIEFYSWELARQYQPVATIGIVTAEPMRSFELLNLLTRHNLPFELIAPQGLIGDRARGLDLLIMLERPDGAHVEFLSAFARQGGTVVLSGVTGNFPWQAFAPLQKTDAQAGYRVGEGLVLELPDQIGDPNTFALKMREVLGRDRRPIDIWNGITVLTVPYKDPSGDSVLLSVVNYAHEPLPVQVRVRGSFPVVHYETPGEAPVLLPVTRRDGHTEFVLPELRIGGRVFLSQEGSF